MSEESASASRPPARELERLRAEVEELRRLKAVDDLLETLTGVLDIRQVFDRVSEISRAVLPHDAIALGRITPDRQSIRVWAHSAIPKGFDIPETVPLPDPTVVQREWDFMVLDDISADETLRRQNAPLLKYGVKSVLRIPLKEDGMIVAALNFLSFRPDAYAARDVLVAKRIAAFVHLALSHHDLAEAARRAAEAQERTRQLERRVEGLVAALAAHGRTSRVIGVSASWKDVLRQAAKVASAETTVLLTGESGTGKEVVARFVHSSSPRASGPFVAINCAALPDTLLESELFGFERGAFSGAHAAKPGRIEAAQGGVLFLDEVGETSPSVQAKLLRVLQEREFQRLGGSRPQRADVRVVAATNRDLAAAMARGTFREDLFYRLAVFEIRLPPLRERPDDILPLAGAFLEEIGAELGRPAAGISRDAMEALLGYRWPGNVRELRNVLERASILSGGGLITHEHLIVPAPRSPASAPSSPERAGTVSPPRATRAPSLADLERDAIERALVEARYNKSRAARALGLTRGQLYGRLRRLGMAPTD
ncbi:MAG TPA: sigma 54-interacting transcriptional regulator [Thermoanaerobaculia bacterium]|nr:sigma 54-interacting transcriptional regulator [Thermoanaerobaculia bacterium]HQN07296.1 sigma 54-interacting transcriptional regulator [Thermoanaerobaculia bacterium]HQP86575.1 sigma 54-interacting transcriptional regulator [Thermoanaerobaculia bacterium]